MIISAMNDNNGNDSSDSDIFIKKQIKPVNKITLREALIIKHTVLSSLYSETNKKKNKKNKSISKDKKIKEKKLIVEPKPKKEVEIPEPASSSFNGKISKCTKLCQKNITLCKNTVDELLKNNSGAVCEKNMKKEVDRNGSKNRVHCEDNIEQSPRTGNFENIPKYSKGKNDQKLDATEPDVNKRENMRKRVEVSPSVSPDRKKLKNTSPTSIPFCTSFEEKESNLKPIVKLENSSSSVVKNLKNEHDFTAVENVDVKIEELFSPSQFELETNMNQEQNDEIRGGSALLCYLFKKMVNDEVNKQLELQQESLKLGKPVEKLFSEEDCEIFEKFFVLEDGACKLFVRMLGRKKDWHRVSTVVYEDIGGDLKTYFHVLKEINFVDANIEDEDCKTQMNLLTNPEIKKLCKLFNVFSKSSNVGKKNDLINSLIMQCKNQKSVLEIIKGKNISSRSNLLKNEVKNYLGMCIRINKNVLKAFNKILILFSFAHYFDEEEKRFSNVLYTCLKVYRNDIKFPNYTLSPSVVFETLADFEAYEASLMVLKAFEMAVNNKNHDEFLAIVTKVKSSFINILKNDEYVKRFLNLPSFLKKFNAGTVYAKILTKYCQTFRKKADQLDIVETVNLLLNQNIFLQNKRADWYELLSIALEKDRNNNAAAKAIVKALKESDISEVQKLTLQLRGQGILKKKTHGISDVRLKRDLGDVCTVSVLEPASIEIKGKALEGNGSGFKCVYVQLTEYGKKYTSVEERAISHYKSHGYTKGYHVEGGIIHSVYCLLFFEIIYGVSPKGVFQTRFQEAPLDFYSSSFYLNRKDKIDSLLSEMHTWDDLKIETTLKENYARYYGTNCVIAWNYDFTPELFCEVIKCITMPVMILIFKRLLQSFKVYRSGFPDLTLWNPETNKIKFVEVKSPNDKLSPAQRIWLDFLRSIELSAEVCNVKNS